MTQQELEEAELEMDRADGLLYERLFQQDVPVSYEDLWRLHTAAKDLIRYWKDKANSVTYSETPF